MTRRRLKDNEAIEHALKILAERGAMSPTGLADYMRFTLGSAPQDARLREMLLHQAKLGTVAYRRTPMGRMTFRLIPPEERAQAVAPPASEVKGPGPIQYAPADPADLCSAIHHLAFAVELHADALRGHTAAYRIQVPPPDLFNGSPRDHAAIPTAG
jgi:hypothetical protein